MPIAARYLVTLEIPLYTLAELVVRAQQPARRAADDRAVRPLSPPAKLKAVRKRAAFTFSHDRGGIMRLDAPKARASLLVLLLALGCAGLRSGSQGKLASFQRNVGTASVPDAMERVPRVLRLFAYEIMREETTPSIMIETHWKSRVPFTDEHNLGITTAENRVMVTGRVRGNTELRAYYNLNLSIDNRVKLMGGEGWVETSATPMYRAYADSLTKHMQRELMIGVRKY
jgi:hypothetical protein